MWPILTPSPCVRVTPRFGVVILAAGASRRLGRSKALVARAGIPLVRHQVQKAQTAGACWIGVAVGCRAPRLRLALEGLSVKAIATHRWREGMGHSLAAAVRAAPLGLRLVILATDQWAVRGSDLARLGRARIRQTCAAEYDGVVGIPASFPVSARALLIHLTGDRGARAQLASAERWSLPEARFDLDTPEDLQTLNARCPGYRMWPR